MAQADHGTFAILFQIIFNIIASVKFNENLKNALNINVLGTRKVLQLAMHMQNLKVSVCVMRCKL